MTKPVENNNNNKIVECFTSGTILDLIATPTGKNISIDTLLHVFPKVCFLLSDVNVCSYVVFVRLALHKAFLEICLCRLSGRARTFQRLFDQWRIQLRKKWSHQD